VYAEHPSAAQRGTAQQHPVQTRQSKHANLTSCQKAISTPQEMLHNNALHGQAILPFTKMALNDFKAYCHVSLIQSFVTLRPLPQFHELCNASQFQRGRGHTSTPTSRLFRWSSVSCAPAVFVSCIWCSASSFQCWARALTEVLTASTYSSCVSVRVCVSACAIGCCLAAPACVYVNALPPSRSRPRRWWSV